MSAFTEKAITDTFIELLNKIETEQYDNIKAAAKLMADAIAVQVLTEHLAAYFKYFDSDYSDLKKLLNMEPLQITILRHGSIADYRAATGRHIPAVNPDRQDIADILRWQRNHR